MEEGGETVETKKMEQEILPASVAKGALDNWSHDGSASCQQKRKCKLSEKGLHYNIGIKLQCMENLYKKLNVMCVRIRELMSKEVCVEEVKNEYCQWLHLYESFLCADGEYNQLISQLSQQEFTERYGNSKGCDGSMKLLQMFKLSVENWFENKYSHMHEVNSQKTKSHKSSKSGSSRSSRRSHNSSILSNISLARLKEEQKQVELRAKSAALQAKLDLEAKLEKLKLETKLAASKARADVLQQYDTKKLEYELDPDAIEFNPVQKLPQCNFSKDKNLTQPIVQSQDVMNALVKELKKPTATIKSFSGDPLQFKSFIRQFHTKVVNYTDSCDEKMNYLEQFTTGEANKIVKGYAYLDSEQGYPAAITELNDRYGNTEVVANAFIKRALGWPVIKSDDPKGLDEYSVFLLECEHAICSLDAVKVLESPENMKNLVKKLPFYLHEKWRSVVQNVKEECGFVKFEALSLFVKLEARKAMDPVYGREALTGAIPKNPKFDNRNISKSKNTFATGIVPSDSSTPINDAQNREKDNFQYIPKTFGKPCIYCKEDHTITNCNLWKSLSLRDRMEFLKFKFLCFGCLRVGHMKKQCRARQKCEICGKVHLTILHVDEAELQKNTKNNAVNYTPVTSFAGQVCNSSDNDEGESCALAVIPVKVKLQNSVKVVQTYAFLDPGSTVSFCSERLMKELGCHGRKVEVTLSTMGKPQTILSNIIKGLEIRALDSDNTISLPKLYTKDNMPVSKNYIPRNEEIKLWGHLHDVNIPVIDGEIALLLGNNVPDAYTPLEVKTGPRGSPHAVRTMLGWTIWNLIRNNEIIDPTVNKVNILAVNEQEHLKYLDNIVRNAFDIDFPEKAINDKKELSREDQYFLRKTSNSMRFVDGHYEIALPFRDEQVVLPDNYPTALKRLTGLEKRFRKEPTFAKDYIQFMNKIINADYAELIPSEELDRNDCRVWYIPHHGVYHQRKNKIRVVFDCAAVCCGVSLNNLLLQGPNLTNDLVDILIRFREENVAIMGDLEAMFYQVRVPKQDRDFLRFLWWPGGDYTKGPFKYRMKVHIFGAASSPACANLALQRTVIDNIDSTDMVVSNCVKNNFYVDDFLKSVATKEEAIQLIQGMTKLCYKGGFHIKDWVSNNKEVIEIVPVCDRSKELQIHDIDIKNMPTQRALGISWNIMDDKLAFKVNISRVVPTRRGILSMVSSLYDPLGILAPFTLPVKLILQQLWKTKLKWDDLIKEEELLNWEKWLSSLVHLEKINVSRCYTSIPPEMKVTNYQIHSFSDASEKGYGVAIYLRTEDENGRVYCCLMIGKSRVAPIKKITIPRMELAAATLAVRTTNKLSKIINYPISKVYFWSDSTAVLHSIYNETTRFCTFVANRLVIIHEGSKPEQWMYVESKDNPADLASRGLYASDNQDKSRLWFSGPEFLRLSDIEWSKRKYKDISSTDDYLEICAKVNIKKEEPIYQEDLFSRYSDWNRLRRVFGCVIKAYYIMKPKVAMKNFKDFKFQSGLTPELLNEAERVICRCAQLSHFEEVKLMNIDNCSDIKVKKSSALYKLDPILVDGLLRVGGRLSRTRISYDAKHPIILPKNSVISLLIVRHAHKEVGHQGKNAMLSYIRQKFWILGSNKLAKKVIAGCVVCRKYRGQKLEQKMADLPMERVTAEEPPFTRVGMDYFGPIDIKRGRNTVKRYGVIFTCLASRAVHLEVAYSLDTSSCINSIRRFMARRGCVKFIRSDNGTNLVGANKELKEEWKCMNHDEIKNKLVNKGIQWEFNPPSGSHFGGVWERLIRSVRKILYSLLKEQPVVLDDEAIQTVFCEVEAILNSRPITATPAIHDDLEPLTPNHLLQLRGGEVFGVNFSEDCYTRKRWRQIQYLVDIFWKRWIREYLPALQERQKWVMSRRNLCIGDIVMVMDSGVRNNYCLGKVIELIKDKAGNVRSVWIKTKDTILERPVVKLCLILESGTENECALL